MRPIFSTDSTQSFSWSISKSFTIYPEGGNVWGLSNPRMVELPSFVSPFLPVSSVPLAWQVTPALLGCCRIILYGHLHPTLDFLVVFLVFPQSLFLTKTDLDHLHSEPCHLGARVRPEWQGVQVRGLPAAVGSGEGGWRVPATEHGRERHLGNASCYLNADGSCLIQAGFGPVTLSFIFFPYKSSSSTWLDASCSHSNMLQLQGHSSPLPSQKIPPGVSALGWGKVLYSFSQPTSCWPCHAHHTFLLLFWLISRVLWRPMMGALALL